MKTNCFPALTIATVLAALASPAFLPKATAMDTSATVDAQSEYSAADVGVARRAFRDQCLKYQGADQCECYTAGFAQALSVPEMRLATALLPARFGKTDAIKAGATQSAVRSMPDEAGRTVAMSHIDGVEKDLANSCNKAG